MITPDPAGLREALERLLRQRARGGQGWGFNADMHEKDVVTAILALPEVAALLDSDKPGLDEERLAKAIWLVQHNTAADHYDRNVPPGSPHRAEVDEFGEQVAAEYARLAATEEGRASGAE